MSYIGTQPVPQSLESRQEFTATASQTTFATNGYTVGYVDVYLNGVKLSTSDFTATNGSDVVLGSGATAGDVLAVVMKNDHSDLVALPITDSAGNNVLSESGGVVTLTADEANVGSNALVVDSSGNVGIGSSPSSNLHVASTTSSTVIKAAASSAGTSVSYLILSGYRNSADQGVLASVDFTNQNTTDTTVASIQGWKEGSSAIDLGYLAFYTKPTSGSLTERMRINSSGNVLVGTDSLVSGGERFCVVNPSNSGDWNSVFSNPGSSPFGILIKYSAASPNGTGNRFIDCVDSTALKFQIRSNGGIANYSANDTNLSDRREKTNFAPAKNYLETICSIPVQTFNYIDQNLEEDDGLTLGVIAQDVQEVAPELVMESNWGTEEEPKMRLSIYQTDLQYALMKSIQEQQTLIESQQSQIDLLTARIEALENT